MGTLTKGTRRRAAALTSIAAIALAVVGCSSSHTSSAKSAAPTTSTASAAPAVSATDAGHTGDSSTDVSGGRRRYVYIYLHNTGNGVGVYQAPKSESNKLFRDLSSTMLDAVGAVCWTRGETIANDGNVWYRIGVIYPDGKSEGAPLPDYVTAYVYGAFVDGNAAFHANQVPAC